MSARQWQRVPWHRAFTLERERRGGNKEVTFEFLEAACTARGGRSLPGGGADGFLHGGCQFDDADRLPCAGNLPRRASMCSL